MIDDQVTSVQSVNLGLGESTPIILVLTVPSELQTINLCVQETGKTDYRPEDNAAEVTLGAPDLTVRLEWEQIGTSTKVAAIVQNIGINPSAGRVTLVDASGAVLSEKYFGETAPGDNVIAEFDVDWDQLGEKLLDVRAVVECFDEENVLYNNSDSIHLIYTGYQRIETIDIKLPASLVTIESEAFAGGKFSTVTIPEGVITIGERAFADSNLKQIDIPASVTSIAEDAFEGTKGLVIYCPAGSEAENFADRNDIYYIVQ